MIDHNKLVSKTYKKVRPIEPTKATFIELEAIFTNFSKLVSLI